MRRFSGFMGALVALAMLVLPGMAPAGTIVADSGFRSTVDGFSFANYTRGPANLGPAQMRRLFGSRVCARTAKGRCVLSPPARQWMASENEGMEGGHCYGFSVLSLMLREGQYPRFGPGPTFGLTLPGNTRLQRSIAYAFAFQSLARVQEVAVGGTPRQALNLLRKELNPANTETWTLGIYQRNGEGGHAITPIAIEQQGPTSYDILVYDNNWPGETRRVSVDTKRNTWRYVAAQNPKLPGALYEGDAQTKSMTVLPTTPGLGVHPCNFCGSQRVNAKGFSELRLDGDPDNHAHLLISDVRGRRIGYLPNGTLVNEIPGAKVIARTSLGQVEVSPSKGGASARLAAAEFRDSLEPIYLVPHRVRFRVKVDGSSLKRPDNEDLTVIGPGYDMSLDNITISPGERAIVGVSPRGKGLLYRRSRGTESPTASFGLDTRRGDYRFRVTALRARANSQLTFRSDRRRRTIGFHDRVRGAQRYRVEVVRIARAGSQRVAGGLTLRGDEKATLRYRGLSRRNPSAMLVIKAPGKRARVLSID